MSVAERYIYKLNLSAHTLLYLLIGVGGNSDLSHRQQMHDTVQATHV
jgi:hypothetical protein